VLIHPGVEELYREIKDREIKDKGFKVLKVER
jgi:hypothetical protein